MLFINSRGSKPELLSGVLWTFNVHVAREMKCQNVHILLNWHFFCISVISKQPQHFGNMAVVMFT